MDATEMQSLLARIEAAAGPETSIDHELEWSFSDWENIGGWWKRHKATGEQKRYTYVDAPPYTASVDAALALVERMLPEWIYAAGVGPGRIGNCVLGPNGVPRHSSLIQNVTASTPPLAILAALLRALLAQQEHAAP